MYFSENEKESLFQGDIFLRFEDKVIPKSEEKELAFIILTYTCDLEHPDDLSYVLYCPIYDFDILIEKFIDKLENRTLIKINSAIKDVVKDLFNNDIRYYFFLSPIPNVSKNPAYVHLEQITKIPKKYIEEIIMNKKASLNKPWREKLGWMTGNLFNRVALVDINKTTSDNYVQNNKIFNSFIETRCNQIKNSLIQYFNRTDEIVNIFKEKLLPIFLINKKTTRSMIKTELIKTFEESKIEKIFEKISQELNSKDNEFLKDMIVFEKKHHKLENFRINDLFKSITNEVLNSNKENA